jgi:hypothetical protein
MAASMKIRWLLLLIASLLAATHSASSMEFRTFVKGGSTNLVARGEIENGDAQRLQAVLEHTNVTGATIYLNSPGGLVIESLSIGAVIRQHRLGTVVATGSECASACVFVFIGGIVREVQPRGRLGVHTASLMFDEEYVNKLEAVLLARSSLSLHEKVQIIVALNEQTASGIMASIANYLAKMGVSMRLLFPTTGASPLDIHWLTDSEMHDYNVINTD